MKTQIKPIHVLLLFLMTTGLLSISGIHPAYAADAAAKSDTLVFSNGEMLAGKLDYEADGALFFKSDNAGTIKVPWDKLKSLHTESPFAVIEIGVRVERKKTNRAVPMGTLTIEGGTLTVNTAQGPQQVSVKNIAYLVDEPTFEKNVRGGQGFLEGITGAVSAGISTVNSTQNSESVNSSVVLTRGVPPVTWMPPRERTLLNFNSSYGRVTEPNTPTVKTNILHGSLEEDEYLTPRFYLLQTAVFDHNFSQGLDLQQLYGFGVGYTAIKDENQQLDLTAVIDYTKQSFAASGSPFNVPPDYKPAYSNDLIGSSFGDNYLRKFTPRILFTEIAAFNPAWNHPSDYSANVAVGATITAYKNLGFSIGLIDSYLNNPPVGFKGNSVQFNTGLTYTIQR